jgi:hypothetical protein
LLTPYLANSVLIFCIWRVNGAELAAPLAFKTIIWRVFELAMDEYGAVMAIAQYVRIGFLWIHACTKALVTSHTTAPS